MWLFQRVCANRQHAARAAARMLLESGGSMFGWRLTFRDGLHIVEGNECADWDAIERSVDATKEEIK